MIGFEFELRYMPFLFEIREKLGDSMYTLADLVNKDKTYVIMWDAEYTFLEWKGVLSIKKDRGVVEDNRQKKVSFIIPEIVTEPLDLYEKDAANQFKTIMEKIEYFIQIIHTAMQSKKANISLKGIEEKILNKYPDDCIEFPDAFQGGDIEDICIGFNANYSKLINGYVQKQKRPLDTIYPQVTFGCDIANMDILFKKMRDWKRFIKINKGYNLNNSIQNSQDLINKYTNSIKKSKYESFIKKELSDEYLKKIKTDSLNWDNLKGLMVLVYYYMYCASKYKKTENITTKNFAGLLFQTLLEDIHKLNLLEHEKKIFTILEQGQSKLVSYDKTKNVFPNVTDKEDKKYNKLTFQMVIEAAFKGIEPASHFAARSYPSEVIGRPIPYSDNISKYLPLVTIDKANKVVNGVSQKPYRIKKENIIYQVAKIKKEAKYRRVGQLVELRNFMFYTATGTKDHKVGIFSHFTNGKNSFVQEIYQYAKEINLVL